MILIYVWVIEPGIEHAQIKKGAVTINSIVQYPEILAPKILVFALLYLIKDSYNT